MTEMFNPVVPKHRAPTDAEFHALIVAGLARVAAKIGRGNLADKMGRTTRSLDKVFAGSTPDARALLDATRADPSVLDELLAFYGFRLNPLESDAVIDFEIIADAADLQAEHTRALRDGRRDHRETIRIAEKARPVVARYSAIIDEADRARGVAK